MPINSQSFTILKNQNRTINLLFEKDDSEKDAVPELKSVEVYYGSGKKDIFIEDEHHNAILELDGKSVEPPVGLLQHANNLKRQFYVNLLQSKYNEIEHLVILSGAGSSVNIGKADILGKTMAGLWDKMAEVNLACLTRLISETKYAEVKDGKFDPKTIVKDLEHLLSLAGMRNKVQETKQLSDDILTAKELITKYCTLELPDQAPHNIFLNKAVLRPQKFPRVKVFTLNYDTLYEQAAAKERFTVIDGFTFSTPRTFNGKYFDYDIIETRHNRQDKTDSTISKLFYLFKMHGSLNWKFENKEVIQFDGPINTKERVMVFPQDSKYEHSYEQPYFEMMARFQQALRVENSLLITIGFSFLDKHISSVILETLKQNPSLHLIALNFPEIVGSNMDYQKELHSIADLQSRITLIAETFDAFSRNYPENIAHNRIDLLEELNFNLKKLRENK